MKTVVAKLKTILYLNVGIVLVSLVLFELNIIPQGLFAGDESAEFVVVSLMELLTICLIPLALRLFRFKKVRADLLDRREAALEKWGALRLFMLCDPLVMNVFGYELFLNAAFGYMAIILALCLVFVLPTEKRCLSEIEPEP